MAAKTKETVKGLRVTAKAGGFRRAGRAWPGTAVDVPLTDLSKDQIALIRAEPMLVVEDVDIAVEVSAPAADQVAPTE